MYLNLSCKFFVLFSIASYTVCSNEFKVTDKVYFDVYNEKEDMGRIIVALFGETAPKTVENFKHICTKGINGRTYVGTRFHRAVKRFMIQGGDIVNNDGTGSISLYGEHFKDENFTIKHASSGILSMANSGPDTNGCQFIITTMAAPWLDGKNVVFGKVLSGHAIIHRIEQMKTDVRDRILNKILITECGLLETVPFYEPAENYEVSVLAWLKAGWLPLSWSFLILGLFQYIMKQLDKYSY